MSWRRLILREQPDHARESPAVSVFLILVTWALAPADAYSLLSSIYSYVFAGFFPAMVGIGMLWLRLKPGSRWQSKIEESSPHFVPWLSLVSALFVVIAGLCIVIVQWIPPSGALKKPLGNV